MEKTIIVISADHGENLGELNIWADHQTADEYTCNVPLIIRWPGNDLFHGVDDGLHYHFDWAATLLDALGGRVPDCWHGESFLNSMTKGPDSGRDHLILSQGAWAAQRSVRFRVEGHDYLFMRTYHDGYKDLQPQMLFDLSDDPHQQVDLANIRKDLVNHGNTLLDTWRGKTMADAKQDIDPLMTVIREGGPFHCRGELADYLVRLRATGRGEHADMLEKRHPQEARFICDAEISII